jgi:hypothetical protein
VKEPQNSGNALNEEKISLFRLIFPPNTFTLVFAQVLLIGCGVSWLAGIVFFQPNGVTVDQIKVLMIGALLQIALLTFLFLKMLRFSQRFRYLPASAAALYSLLHISLAVKVGLSQEEGVFWYIGWALVGAFCWWLFNSSRVDQLLHSNAIRYKLVHGRDPYEELNAKSQKKGR